MPPKTKPKRESDPAKRFLPPPQAAANIDGVDRRAIARMLMKLFDHWKLSTDEQLAVLGYSPTSRAILTRYRRGEPISKGRDTLDRAGHLLGIHESLRSLFPHNRNLAYAWIRSGNQAFENRTPIEVICEFGFAGLVSVRAYLDEVRNA